MNPRLQAQRGLPIDPDGPPICAAPDLKIMALPPLDQVNLRGEFALLAPLLKSAIGTSCPERPNTVSRTASDQYRCIWLGPNEVLVTGPQGSTQIAELLGTDKKGKHLAISDVSDLRVAFRMTGARTESVLAKGCPLDFVKIKDCAQTLIGRVNVLLVRIDDGYEILVWRSFAAYLNEWLRTAH